MRVDRHLFRLLSLGLALAIAACGKDAPLSAPAESTISSQSLAATFSTEMVRTANRALASASVYDSLMAAQSSALAGNTLGAVATVSVTLAQCQPQPYAVVVQTVGPRGGTLRAGSHSLVIPQGALSKNTVITMEAPVATHAQVELRPHGLVFSSTAKPTLTLSYKNCEEPASLGTALGVGDDDDDDEVSRVVPMKIVYTDDLLNILEVLKSQDQRDSKRVISRLDHFSSYVVAY